MSSKKIEKEKDQFQKQSCFVVMPYGGWFDSYYSSIYKPAIEEAGLNPMRADDIYRPSTIIKDVWELTKKAAIVLADLSGKNANVFYELGLAHALAKPAILISESMDHVPFDLRALRVIEFDKNDFEWGAILKQKITSSVRETLASPLASVLPTFLEISEDSKEKLSKQDIELLEIKQDLELIKSNIRSYKIKPQPLMSAKDMDVIRLLSIGLGINEIAQKFDQHTSEISAILIRLHNISSTLSVGELIDWGRENNYC